MTIHGQLFDGKTSAAHACQLGLVGPGRVGFNWAGHSVSYRLEELDISSRLGNTPRHLALPNGARFETKDNDAVDALLLNQQGGAGFLRLHRMESSMRYVLLAVLVTVVFVWGMVQYGLPAAARAVATQLPVVVSTQLSDQVLAQFDERLFSPSLLPEERKQSLQRRFDEVLAGVEQNYPFQLLFRRGGNTLGANAFALPSGLIVMTDELIELAEHDNELVAIMAHEVGHVVHRHGLRQVLQHSALVLIITYMTGDTSSLVGALPVMLMQLGYSREFEREADAYALDYLRQAGIDSAHFAHIMQRLDRQHDDESGIGNYLSTHPATSERIQPFLQD